VHGSSRHIGHAYHPPMTEAMERTAMLSELRDRLQRAIEKEQFELAADLRDRIKVLE
jgi:protein arginine kinase activator